MILADTAVWIEHFRKGHPILVHLLLHGAVLGHPWVTGEIALGHLSQRRALLGLLGSLPAAPVATPEEVLFFIDRHQLMGSGIGYVDVQLLAATALTPDATFWTSDRRLAAVASRLGLGVDPAVPANADDGE